MGQVCNLVYHRLTEGKSAPQKAEFDAMLVSPADKEEAIARQNEAAMKQLMGGGVGFIPPPKKSNGHGNGTGGEE
jgi:hypothetical protein